MEPVPNLKKQIPVILGRPFLATANACINCRTGVMDLSFGNMKVKLNVFHASDQPARGDECFLVDKMDDLVEEALPYILADNPLEMCLAHVDIDNFDVDKAIEEVNSLLDNQSLINSLPWKTWHEPLPTLSSMPLCPSIESPPKFELKPLLVTL